MNSRNPIRLAVFGAATVLALVTSACGLGSNAASSTKVDTTAAIKGTISFQTLQLTPTFTDFVKSMISGFEKQYPGTTVKWTDIPSAQAGQKISADSVAGTLPDVLNVTQALVAPLARKNLVLDMASVASDAEGTYVPAAWQSFKVGTTKVAAMPWYLNTGLLLYNKSLLQKAGLDPANPPKTFDELKAASLQIASKTGKAGYHPALATGLTNNLQRMGVSLVNSDQTKAEVDTPTSEAYLNELKALYDKHALPSDSIMGQQRSDVQAYQDGNTAFIETGPSRLKLIKQNAPGVFATTGVAPQLTGPAGTTWVLAQGLAVPTSSKNKSTALAFAKYVTNAANQLALSKLTVIFPSATAALSDPYFTASGTDVKSTALRLGAAQIKTSTPMPHYAAVDEEFAQVMMSAAQSVIVGQSSAKQALSAAQTKLDGILSRRTQ